MEGLSTEKYNELIFKAIKHFWDTRNAQVTGSTKADQGNRSAVTGGKQLDGFIELLVKVSEDLGVPKTCIYTKGNSLPGYFRPTKDWDFLIISPKKQLIAVIEFKSQVGSFGNNFNNRTEEALGSAVDFWTAFREQGFIQTQVPWVGYVILVEKADKSTFPVRLQEPYFNIRPEFQATSYLDRYALLCQKLMQERHYTATSLIWTNEHFEYGALNEDISFDSFMLSFMGFIQGKLKDIVA
ncbi:PaeR7I family type II restriction endonuclease [Haliscomenobacter hydrossis]|uniref:Type II site-specific deoxyribonuclease n=1 Tax=Haliscomenobacter hydrossis (strain ATCC 27775 / DSM 1100 / LMG 10767 / O) TaxID=760192 RepID=F4KTK4_HALH1|nr:PaeR7I family type II restriction endonuclease [Haliscomenobacter hydrossis]AEE53378.1 Type II site-specific deoxyribonuclease [Haliscomenobacter hydrossis DSM 1100]